MSGQYDIDYLLEEVVTLPSLPSTVARITELLDSPDCSLSEVGKVISSDPSIALKTLRLVNSAYYGLLEKVTSVEHAVALLGIKVVKNLVFTATVFDSLKSSVGSFLRHSIGCGLVMRAIVEEQQKESGIENGEEAFVFGLLHDIGKVVFEQFLNEEYLEIARICEEQKRPSFEVEREIIGVDHAEMGARLAMKWRLADNLIYSIRAHHDLSQCEEDRYLRPASLLGVADYVCCASGLSALNNGVPPVSDEMWEHSGFSGESIPPVLTSFFSLLPTLEELARLAE